MSIFIDGAAEWLTSGADVSEYGHQGEQRQQNPASEAPDVSNRGYSGGWQRRVDVIWVLTVNDEDNFIHSFQF